MLITFDFRLSSFLSAVLDSAEATAPLGLVWVVKAFTRSAKPPIFFCRRVKTVAASEESRKDRLLLKGVNKSKTVLLYISNIYTNY